MPTTADVGGSTSCPQCGAPYDASGASCAERFAQLLALDHSRTEPWGSRHGLAFSVYVLQHPLDYAPAVRAGCWRMLYRVYVQGVDRMEVVREMRSADGSLCEKPTVPALPGDDVAPRTFGTTIADLGSFAADEYPARLDVWCRATLAAYGA